MPRREMGDVALIKGNEATTEFWVVEIESRNQLRLRIGRVIAKLDEVDKIDTVNGGLDGAGSRIVTSILTLSADVIEIAVVARSSDRVPTFW